MLTRYRIALALLAAMGTTAALRGDAPDRQVAAFIDAEAFVVGRVDVARIDLDQIWSEFDELLSALGEQERMQIEGAREALIRPWLTNFVRAGGREIYMVASIADFPGADKPVFVIPLAEGADGRALGGMLTNRWIEDWTRPLPDGLCATHINDAVVLGEAAQLKRVRGLEPVRRPELTQAFAAVEGADLQIVFIPPDYSRRVIEALVPTLPGAFANEPTTTVTRGVQWAALGLHLPPGLSFRLVIGSADADAAGALERLILRGIEVLRQTQFVKEHCPGLAQLAEAFAPTRTGDRLVVALDSVEFRNTLQTLALPAMRDARDQAKRAVSMANLRGIAMAVHVYASNHKQRFPADLRTLLDAGLITENMLANPRQPSEPRAYVLMKTDRKLDQLRPPSTAIIAYEKHDEWPAEGLAAAFADGHVEWIRDESRFQTGLAATRTTADE